MTRNVIEMLRVSSDKQDVARQEYDVADNRREHGCCVIRQIRITISGTLVMTDKEVKAMLAALSDPSVSGISVSAIDRLFRPGDYDALGIFTFFCKARKVIVSTKEGLVEPWTDRGWDICMGAAHKAGAELRELKRRSSGGRRRAQEEKRMCITRPPYGMVYVSKYEKTGEGRKQCLIEDTTPAIKGQDLSRRQVVVMMFEWRLVNKLTPGEIALKLNRMGILTAGLKGQYEPGLWSRATVRQILSKRKYIGEHVEGGEVMECPKFIEPATFEAVQNMRGACEMTTGRKPTKYLLCGILRCAICGKRYQTASGRNHRLYKCGNYDGKIRTQVCRSRQIQCRVLDDAAFRPLWQLLTNGALLHQNATEYVASLPSQKTTAKTEARLAAVKSRLERTRELVREGAYDTKEGIAKIREDQKEIATLETELRATGSVMTLPAVYQVKAVCNEIAQGPEPETFEERRPVLDKLVDLAITYNGETRELEMSGKVAVPDIAAPKKAQNRNRGINDDNTSVLYIPFRIKERVA